MSTDHLVLTPYCVHVGFCNWILEIKAGLWVGASLTTNCIPVLRYENKCASCSVWDQFLMMRKETLHYIAMFYKIISYMHLQMKSLMLL